MKQLLAVLALPVVLAACEPNVETVPLPTKICVKTQHHTWIIPSSTVYIKYNVDSFPGYNRPADYFDAVFKTGRDARGCFESIPEGRHWLVAYGYDSLYWPHDVRGSLPFSISLDKQPVLDTILYVSE